MYGCHVAFSKTLTGTFKLANTQGCTAFQFFLGSNRSFKRTAIAEHDFKSLQAAQGDTSTPMFVHSPYVFSLTRNFGNTKEGLLHELRVCGRLKSAAVILHVGSYSSLKSLEDGVKEVSKNIKQLYDTEENLGTLLIENMAGQGKMMPNKLETIAEILKAVNNKKVGWCFDTCHGFASGMVDLRRIEEIDKFYDDIEKQVGIESLKAIHLNDSEKPYDSHKDLHANLKKGCIWKEHPEALVYFIEKFKSIPMIAETADWAYDRAVLKEIMSIKCDKKTIVDALRKHEENDSRTNEMLLKLLASCGIRFDLHKSPKKFMEEVVKKDKELKFLVEYTNEVARVLECTFNSQKIVSSCYDVIDIRG
eukprot:TRINITY_DN3055_c0_g1_i4.p1 TRINITY_DN3055_c0_g1~~TRINITY_DN3055_c0_g1_i4.p1  ORF type:complete len:363 (+),score=95.83 TRINITY_DN3055_c0_g1_i4:78-1166(+)